MPQRAGFETSRAKERQWFHSSFGETLTATGRELFEKYSTSLRPTRNDTHTSSSAILQGTYSPGPA